MIRRRDLRHQPNPDMEFVPFRAVIVPPSLLDALAARGLEEAVGLLDRSLVADATDRWYRAYFAGGQPYGASEDGFRRWLAERMEAGEDEQVEIERKE